MIPRIVHFCHFGDPPSEQVWANIERAREVNPRWSHMLWTEETMKCMGGAFMEWFDPLQTLASKSNLARLFILERMGGIYIDTDCECIHPLEEIGAHRAFAAMQDGERICNAVMGAEPCHEWIQWQINHWHDFDQNDPASGVYLASAAPRDGLTIIPQHLVYPFLYDTPREQRRPHPQSVLMHHWAGSWCK